TTTEAKNPRPNASTAIAVIPNRPVDRSIFGPVCFRAPFEMTVNSPVPRGLRLRDEAAAVLGPDELPPGVDRHRCHPGALRLGSPLQPHARRASVATHRRIGEGEGAIRPLVLHDSEAMC